MGKKLREGNRSVFALLESNPRFVNWGMENGPVPLDVKQYPVLAAATDAMCREAGIEPITLYTADMIIPHVVALPGDADKSKLVVSNLLLQPPFNEEQAAMYVAHKLGHQFHGVKHVLSKTYPNMVRSFTNGAMSVEGIRQVRDKKRETEADREAIAIFNRPAVLRDLLTNMWEWCKNKKKDPDIIYPGIQARIEDAQKLVEQSGAGQKSM